MSTRINVTVGDGGLLDRNAQQTAANRQARVLADQRAAAEAEGVERRAADRTAAGLNPLTGLPASTPSSASTINRLDQEPAANRRGDALGFFYLSINGGTSNTPPAVQVVSGDGSATASHTFEHISANHAYKAVAPELTPKYGPWPNLDGQNLWQVTETTAGVTAIRGLRTTTVVSTERITTTNEEYNAQLSLSTFSGISLFALPLANGACIFVMYRSILLVSKRTDAYTIRVADTFFNSLDADVSAEMVLEPTTVDEYAAFRVGYGVAQPVNLPTSLLDKLREHTGAFTATPVTSKYTNLVTVSCPSSNPATCFGLWNTLITYDDFELSLFPQYEYTPPGLTPRYLSTGSVNPYLFSYINATQFGVWDAGAVAFQFVSTPASWFAVDSPLNFALLTGSGNYFDLGTISHDEVTNITLENTSIKIASLLSPSRLLGIPSDSVPYIGSIFSLTAAGQMYAWSARTGYMEGPAAPSVINPLLFPYPYNTPDNYWRRAGPKFKAGLASPSVGNFELDQHDSWRRVFIYDWGKPAFCRQQAARYGLL